ncbi:hypothetical protein [Mesorhizobium sp. M0676]|uniref:hypothetical protein n=1 Tax=unclassified Mesorhizobium TaxID=325217 RepID=UPI003339A1A1
MKSAMTVALSGALGTVENVATSKNVAVEIAANRFAEAHLARRQIVDGITRRHGRLGAAAIDGDIEVPAFVATNSEVGLGSFSADLK